jgi:hypothetical protein
VVQLDPGVGDRRGGIDDTGVGGEGELTQACGGFGRSVGIVAGELRFDQQREECALAQEVAGQRVDAATAGGGGEERLAEAQPEQRPGVGGVVVVLDGGDECSGVVEPSGEDQQFGETGSRLDPLRGRRAAR